eukprot:847031_1
MANPVFTDPNSCASSPDIIRTKHVALDLVVDFDVKKLIGSVELTFDVLQPTDEFVLDTRDLSIKRVTFLKTDAELKFSLLEPSALGCPLSIALPADLVEIGSSATIRIDYETSPEASAIQWLTPEQTAGKKHPYLFTQCQAIHCRSMIPIQDMPGVKVTYSARIRAPKPLTVLMSALRKENKASDDGKSTIFSFDQPVCIPSYLIALAVGNLTSLPVGPRSDVWCEPEMVEAAAWEFAETEKFIQIAEEIVGKYEWTRYDLLMLPPSFPYGGMENPCLTFVTPTLIAGDRSLADVVAHEISHSWFGNLVTNKKWEDFWLNEGMTVFLERKIGTKFHDFPGFFDLSALEGFRSLEIDVNEFGNDSPFTRLVPELSGMDPDDAFSSVPYEKGFTFLMFLQGIVGEEPMVEFLREHCKRYKFGVVDSYGWKDFFLEFFKDKVSVEKLKSIEWEKWFKSTGMPLVIPKYDRTLVDQAQRLAAVWMEGADVPESAADFEEWTAKQKILFLNRILEIISQTLGVAPAGELIQKMRERLTAMAQFYKLPETKNCELLFRYLMGAITTEDASAYDKTVEFLGAQGRMKYVRKIYRNMYSHEPSRQLALDTFTRLRGFYHPIASKMIAKDLKMS